ncbi:MAG: YHS domain-containing (seleno)protein [Alphaproteobacteria bacterium]|nr:YHS domain-containing (seleno)protein [Alphaproteobacteria bacterium]
MSRSPHRTAFVFAGGGSLGAIQVGALRELVAAGERPDLVVGASVGALNACYFAGRPNAEGVAALEAVWISLARQDVFPFTFRGALSLLRGGGSVFESHGLRRIITRHLAFERLEETEIPVHVVATNLSGEAVCLSRGPAIEAVLASSAIPIAFPSVEIEADHLIDGAIAGNTPILTAAELGATRIIVLQTGYACSLAGPPPGAVGRGLHAVTLLIANQMERDLRLISRDVQVHVAPHLCPLDVSPFNFGHSAALIERSAAATRSWLASGGLSIPASPDVFQHDHTGMMPGAPLGADGADLVTYFAGSGPPQRGVEAIAAEHAGVRYLFNSAANRDLFRSNPERYLPQYAGRCAYAAAHGTDAPGDPALYRIIDGRLYFNRTPAIQAKWERAAEDNIRRADAHQTAKNAP